MKTIVCVMLACDRLEMTRRSAASFRAQEYPAKRLLIWNTGNPGDYVHLAADDIAIVDSNEPHAGNIGVLRNKANQTAVDEHGADYLAHWDSDDWSHPRRLVEQCDLLEHTGSDVVGYREALFWDTAAANVAPWQNRDGEAWIYRNNNQRAPIGASFLYPVRSWERYPFPHKRVGEDTLWLLRGKTKIMGIPSTWSYKGLANHEPRMICEIHGGNTSSRINATAAEWRRAEVFDEYCRFRMRV